MPNRSRRAAATALTTFLLTAATGPWTGVAAAALPPLTLPVTLPDVHTTRAGAPLVVPAPGVLGNDLGANLVAERRTLPSNGGVVVNGDGSFTYTPNPGFSGVDTFTYTARNGAVAQKVEGLVTIVVGPSAAGDAHTTSLGAGGTAPTITTTATTGVLANDRGIGLVATLRTQPQRGSVVMAPDGSFSYVPEPGASGRFSFTYRVTDLALRTADAVVTITVDPRATDDTAATTAGAPVGVDVLANDVGTTLTASVRTAPAHGIAAVQANGRISYTPAAGFSGVDSFTYTATDPTGATGTATVRVTVTPAPVVNTVTMRLGESLTVAAPGLLANDLGRNLVIESYSQPSHGSVTVNPDGSYVYTNTSPTSSDTFTYRVRDQDDLSSSGGFVTITLQLTPAPPNLVDDSATTTTGSPVTVGGRGVLANDSGSPVSAGLVAGPSRGTLTWGGGGSYTYVPNPGFSGTDSFTYTATNAGGTAAPTPGTVRIRVDPVLATDTADTTAGTAVSGNVLANDPTTGLSATRLADPAHGTLTLSAGGAFTYLPAPGWSGDDSFTYRATDASGLTAVGTVHVVVRPVAVDDNAATVTGNPSSGDLLGNDTGAGLTTAVLSGPSSGTLTLGTDGQFSYVPGTGWSGRDSFTYRVTDAAARTMTARVDVLVVPTTARDTLPTTAGTPVSGNVLTNDAGTRLTAEKLADPVGGTVVLATDGTFTYTPAGSSTGTDSFPYRVTDAAGLTSDSWVDVVVGATVVVPPPPPVAPPIVVPPPVVPPPVAPPPVVAPPVAPTPSPVTAPVDRVTGSDRVSTGVAVSRDAFPQDRRAAAAVVATSARFADAIAGARLAGQVHGPLLLTSSERLEADVAAEVRRVVAPGGTVYLLGRQSALSDDVQAELADLDATYTVVRLGGADRFETAVQIADEVRGRGDDGPVYLATGLDFPDGLAVSALATHSGGVVLLTRGGELDPATRAYLDIHDPQRTRVVPVGGAAARAVPEAAARAIVGLDRYDTARRIAARFAPTAQLRSVGLATGADWPDALVGAATMGTYGGPLLLTSRDELEATAREAITALNSGPAQVRRGFVFGGEGRVSVRVLADVAALLRD